MTERQAVLLLWIWIIAPLAVTIGVIGLGGTLTNPEGWMPATRVAIATLALASLAIGIVSSSKARREFVALRGSPDAPTSIVPATEETRMRAGDRTLALVGVGLIMSGIGLAVWRSIEGVAAGNTEECLFGIIVGAAYAAMGSFALQMLRIGRQSAP